MIRKLARPMLASVFVASGVDMLKNTAEHREGTEELIAKLRAVVPNQYRAYIPTDPDTVTRAIGGAQAASAGLLAMGKAPRLTAGTLAALTIPTMLSRYAFWETQDPKEKQERRNGLLTNTALLGGLMIATADTQGKPGLMWRAEHAGKQIQKSLPTKSETEKFTDKATEKAQEFFGDASEKVSAYVDAATTYIDDNKDDWLERAQKNSEAAKSKLVKAAAVAQDRAAEFQAQAAKEAGRRQKQAEKSAKKFQKRADKATSKAQKKFKNLDI